MKVKYYKLMLTSFALVFIFDTLVLITKKSVFESDPVKIISSVYVVEIIVFVLINLMGARKLFLPMEEFLSGRSSGGARVKQRALDLPLFSAYWTAGIGAIPAILWSAATVATLPSYNTIGLINLLVGSLYGYVLFPAFLVYILIDNFTKELKQNLFEDHEIVFELGSSKLWKRLFFMFFVVSIMPLVAILLDIAASGMLPAIIFSEQSFIVSSVMTVFIAVGIGTYMLTKNLTRSFHFIASAFERVKKGNYAITLPIIEDDEKGILLDSFNLMTKGLREREFIKDTFGKYINPEVAEEILKKEIELSGVEKPVTVLFTDIANYTSISERLSPPEVVHLLNTYFSELVEIITRNKGVVNKFIGDAIMAVFNDPVSDPRHADNALQAGIEIHSRCNKGGALKTRIGINTGTVVVGNIGTNDRMEYTVIGDVVNTAQRLEAGNKEFGTFLLVGQNTFDNLADTAMLVLKGRANLKGKAEAVNVYGLKKENISDAG